MPTGTALAASCVRIGTGGLSPLAATPGGRQRIAQGARRIPLAALATDLVTRADRIYSGSRIAKVERGYQSRVHAIGSVAAVATVATIATVAKEQAAVTAVAATTVVGKTELSAGDRGAVGTVAAVAKQESPIAPVAAALWARRQVVTETVPEEKPRVRVCS